MIRIMLGSKMHDAVVKGEGSCLWRIGHVE